MFDNEVTWLTKCFRYEEYYKVESIANCYLSPFLCILLIISILFVVNFTLKWMWKMTVSCICLSFWVDFVCWLNNKTNLPFNFEGLKNIITDQSKCILLLSMIIISQIYIYIQTLHYLICRRLKLIAHASMLSPTMVNSGDALEYLHGGICWIFLNS